MQINPIAVKDEYKAGDVITITPKDYMYGLIVGTQIYVNLPLNKPISATSASLTITSPSLSIATVQGQKDATSVRVVSVSIANATLQFNIDTNISSVDVSPIALGMNGTITFS